MGRSRDALRKLGLFLPDLPLEVSKRPLPAEVMAERSVRFSLAPTSGELQARIVIELEDSHAVAADALSSVPEPLTEIAEGIEALFPDADPEDSTFPLSSYVVVSLPLTRQELGPAGHDVARKVEGLAGVRRAGYEGILETHGSMLRTLLEDGPVPPDKSWSRKAVRIRKRRPSGAGVVIAHPDTGWAVHDELEIERLDLGRAYNTFTNDKNAQDPLDFLLFNGHGTATATVMVSGEHGEVWGIAPGATILPIRCVRSVVLIGDVDLARAVWHADRSNAHVISISVGGLPAPWLETVVAHAVHRKNMIVCAAAGNLTWWVVFPAAYRDCIAVGGSNVRGTPYAKGSYGPQIDVCAPAAGVWVADFDDQKRPISANPGWGTSFSAPHVAAAAALWLDKHGRAPLLRRYGGVTPLQEVFRLLLRETAYVPQGVNWDGRKFGEGILDVAALLAARLPDGPALRAGSREEWRDAIWIDILRGAFHHLEAASVGTSLANLFRGAQEGQAELVERYGLEFAQLSLTDNASYQLASSQLSALGAKDSVSNIGTPPEADALVSDAGRRLTVQFQDWLGREGSSSLNRLIREEQT